MRERALEMVEGHVRKGQGIVDRQIKIVEQLRALGLPTLSSESLLQTFLVTQALHCEHLARLRRELLSGGVEA